MPSVAELTALYGNFMLAPRRGPGFCDTCFDLTDGYERCYSCRHREQWLDAVTPISYSVGREQLHHVLRGYKREGGETARRFRLGLAAVLWRFLVLHERCVARAARTQEFDLVTTVPSSDRERDEEHPLRRIVRDLTGPTTRRYERLLRRAQAPAAAHEFHPKKFEAIGKIEGTAVLLIDDTWTTGANAQSAAAALKGAGASHVAAVVIGRYLNRAWRENDRRLRGLAAPYDWGRCALRGAPEPSR